MTQASQARLNLRIRGRVQGVFFRACACEEGRALGLCGWVRNRLDGSVEITAEGPRARLEILLAWAYQGPPAARVDSVGARWSEFRGEFSGFAVRY